MRNSLIPLRFTAFGMLVVSAALIILGVYFYVEKDKRLKEYRLIKCKVIKIDEPVSGSIEITLREINGNYPPFIYYDHYDPSEDEIDYKLDEIYDVYYYEKDTSKSEIKSFIENYETGFIFFIIGIVFLIDAPIMLFVANLRKKALNKSNLQYTGIEKESVIKE